MEIKPQAVVIPKETDQLEQGKYGPIYPRTPACYGFTIISRVKPGRAEAIRGYGLNLASALEKDPYLLAPLKLHYLRWVLFDDDTRFMYQGIFDTNFDKYTEDAIALFGKAGVNTVFENLEGFPMDWKTNPDAFIKFVRAHQCPSFIEYGEYLYVTADEIKKALRVKNAFSEIFDQFQCKCGIRRRDYERIKQRTYLQPEPRATEIHAGPMTREHLHLVELPRRGRPGSFGARQPLLDDDGGPARGMARLRGARVVEPPTVSAGHRGSTRAVLPGLGALSGVRPGDDRACSARVSADRSRWRQASARRASPGGCRHAARVRTGSHDHGA